MNMKNTTKVVAAIIALITGIVQVPGIQQVIVHQIDVHPAVAAGVAGLSSILAIVYQPSKQASDSASK